MSLLRINLYTNENGFINSFVGKFVIVSRSLLDSVMESRFFNALDVVSCQLYEDGLPFVVILAKPEVLAHCVEVYEGIYFVPFSLWHVVLDDLPFILLNEWFCQKCLNEDFNKVSMASFDNENVPWGELSWWEQMRGSEGAMLYAIKG